MTIKGAIARLILLCFVVFLVSAAAGALWQAWQTNPKDILIVFGVIVGFIVYFWALFNVNS